MYIHVEGFPTWAQGFQNEAAFAKFLDTTFYANPSKYDTRIYEARLQRKAVPQALVNQKFPTILRHVTTGEIFRSWVMHLWQIKNLIPKLSGSHLRTLSKQKRKVCLHVLAPGMRYSGWWFGTCVIFPYIGNNHPNWRIFFRGVQTTNQYLLNLDMMLSIRKLPPCAAASAQSSGSRLHPSIYTQIYPSIHLPSGK